MIFINQIGWDSIQSEISASWIKAGFYFSSMCYETRIKIIIIKQSHSYSQTMNLALKPSRAQTLWSFFTPINESFDKQIVYPKLYKKKTLLKLIWIFQISDWKKNLITSKIWKYSYSKYSFTSYSWTSGFHGKHYFQKYLSRCISYNKKCIFFLHDLRRFLIIQH